MLLTRTQKGRAGTACRRAQKYRRIHLCLHSTCAVPTGSSWIEFVRLFCSSLVRLACCNLYIPYECSEKCAAQLSLSRCCDGQPHGSWRTPADAAVHQRAANPIHPMPSRHEGQKAFMRVQTQRNGRLGAAVEGQRDCKQAEFL